MAQFWRKNERSMSTSRRAFLKHTAARLAVCAVEAAFEPGAWGTPPLDGAAPGPSPQDWYDRPMRWAQIVFAEDDPGNYDPALWLDYFKRTHTDAACLSAGGAVAFYPTTLPLHYRSKWLGSGDAFGDLQKHCRALGMNVIARTDAHACHKDVYEKHPDWIAVDEHGSPRRHPSDPDFWITCALGPYNFDFMSSVHEEIMSMYMPDGIFTNRWAGSGMCYCVHCQKNFFNFSGLALPHTRDPLDPARRQYIQWHQHRLFQLWRLWNAKIQSINPNASYIANAGGGALSDLDMKTVGDLAPTLFADRQGRSGVMPPWANGKNGKEYRATMGRKAIVGIFSMGLEEKYRWKDSVQSGDEIRMWVMEGVAQGLRPWYAKFNAKIIDARWMPVVEEIYLWHWANETYLRNVRSLARVALVYSQQTAAFYGGADARARVEDPSLGFYQALVEARLPFDMVHDHLLDREHTEQYRTLILPNIAALSSAQCRLLEDFVERGGRIVATFETSLYDEVGVRRENFGLASLFGVDYAGRVEGPMLNSYLQLNKDPATGQYHPLLKGLEDAGRIINAVNQVVVPTGSGVYPLQVIPTYPDLPMEEVFPRKNTTKGQPGAVARVIGKGRVVYLPGDIDRTFWEVLDADHARLLRNAVLWATDETPPLTVQGEGMLDVSVWTQKNSVTAHLVNLTNPMMMKGSIRELIPISEQKVSLRLPPGRQARRVHLLVTRTEVPYTNVDGVIHLEIPSVRLHEVVAVDLA